MKDKMHAMRPDAPYEVGYGKPPKHSQFAPGTSGNPRGRPKGAKNKLPALNEERLKDIIMAEAYRDINVRDGEHNVTMPMAQAVVRSLAVNAAKGQHRAQRLFAEMLSSTERQNKQLADEWLNVAMDYKIEWDRELARRDARGITHLPEPLPHPDQVKIDMNTGAAWIEGPVTKEDAAKLEWLAERRDDVCKELEELRQNLETERNEALRKLILDEIERNETLLAKLDPALKAAGYG